MLTSLPPTFTSPTRLFLLRASVSATFVVLALGMTGCSPSSADNQQKSAPTNSTTMTPATTSATPTSVANDPAIASIQQALAQNLVKSGITAKVQSVQATQMPNIYWVKADGLPPFFTDKTGQYIFQGDIVKVGGAKAEHISADLQAQDAKAVLAGIDKKDMIIFPATGATKGVIYAFTDADCGYCRKLHSEIKQINALGIEVRYLPWPRSEESFPIMQKIWCSKDRNAALTKAKNGENIDAPQCDNPVAKLHTIGTGLGINGTPAIFTEDGKQIGGYLPPQALAQALHIQ